VSNPAPESEAGATQTENRSRSVDGAAFVFGVPEIVPAVWGEGRSNLWAKGEGLMLVGPDGVGKTTLIQQLALARIGLRRKLLDLAVEDAPRRVLYIAADRPRQAASSMRRMVTADDTDDLRNRLVVWRGPLPINVVEKPRALLDWIRSEFGDVSDVFVDSLKDIALDLTKDETGSRVNIAFQELIADSIELAVSHHQRKEHQGGGKPKRLADVYGSRWLTAGMGSVVLLWGEPGDLVVELRHLKQPVEEAGPWNVIHDHSRGLTTLEEGFDLEAHVTASTEGITVRDAAARLFTTADPSKNEIEKARRKLDGLVRNGVAYRRDDENSTARYFGGVTPVTRSVTSRPMSRRVTALAFKPHARGHGPSRPLHVTAPYKEWGARDREPTLNGTSKRQGGCRKETLTYEHPARLWGIYVQDDSRGT
jgi:replicative DNA helicase